jgi:capsular exopolysaccharide synthesis family protein
MSRVEEALRRAAGGISVELRTPAPRADNPFVPESAHVVSGVHEFPLQNSGTERQTNSRDSRRTVVASERPRYGETRPIAEEVEGKILLDDEMSVASVEEYRRLATSLHQLQLQTGLKKVMVSSAMPRDGKTLTSTNLALTLSDSFKRRVLLIDADLRRPSIHSVFKIGNAHGLSDGLRADARGALPLIEVSERLSVLPAGAPDRNPMASLTSDRMLGVLSEAVGRFDWVILDTPPIGLISDASLLAGLVDGVLLVIGAGTTHYGSVQRTISEVGRERIVGVVLNRVDQHTAKQLQYHRYYRADGDDHGWNTRA